MDPELILEALGQSLGLLNNKSAQVKSRNTHVYNQLNGNN